MWWILYSLCKCTVEFVQSDTPDFQHSVTSDKYLWDRFHRIYRLLYTCLFENINWLSHDSWITERHFILVCWLYTLSLNGISKPIWYIEWWLWYMLRFGIYFSILFTSYLFYYTQSGQTSGATCLLTDCCFSELAIKIQHSMLV